MTRYTDLFRTRDPSVAALVAAYAVVYLVWGSTYLAIRFAVESIPPLLMAGSRFVVAGGALLAVLAARREPMPGPREWGGSLVTGTLMLAAGVGAVSWAEQRIPSGIAALLVAIVPIWMVLLEWARTRERPSPGAFVGLALGLLGVAVLISPREMVGGAPTDLLGAVVVLCGTVSWAAGSVYGTGFPRPENPFMAAAAQMLSGGLVLVAVGLAAGEPLEPAAWGLRSLLSWGYLVLFGSIVAFSAYTWLLRVDRASRVGTYAYVNPVVAVLLGWALAGEPLSTRVLVAAGTVVAAVVLIRRARFRPSTSRQREEDRQPTSAESDARGPDARSEAAAVSGPAGEDVAPACGSCPPGRGRS